MLGVTNAPDMTAAGRTPVPRLLVVPAEPGPLADLAPAPRDAEADEEVVERPPGWLDGVLFAGGLALIAWGSLALDSTGVIAVGAGLAALGSVVPVRAAWRRVEDAGRRRKEAALRGSGTVLDAGDPQTAELVAAYDALLDAAHLLDSVHAREAAAAAHAAVSETAALLAGGRPETPRQAAYIVKRVRAIAALTDAITGDDARPDPLREARTDAHEALENMGASSLTELAELTDALRRG
jgi:hypothetical protein